MAVRRVASSVAAAVAAAALVVGAPGRASAQEAPPAPLDVNLRVDGAILAGALIATGVAALLPLDAGARWGHELLPLDEPIRQRFSLFAARVSDGTVALAVAAPLAMQVLAQAQADGGVGRATAERALVFGEAVAVSVAANAVTKHVVGRPRPYTYNDDPGVQAYADRQGRDSRLSFYSGHAATAFAAAVAGGYLTAHATTDTAARTATWASGLALAGATATLRVRAGKHFPSDVLVGALAGAGIGWAVPALHVRSGAPDLAPAEWIAIGVAPVAGAALAALVPMPSEGTAPVVVPWVSGSGGGVIVARRF